MTTDGKGASGEVSNCVANSLGESIEKIRAEASELVSELEAAAEALREQGLLPRDQLADAIIDLRSSFRRVWSRLGESAAQAGVELESLGDELLVDSLATGSREIGVAVAAIRSGEGLRSAAVEVLRKVGALCIVSGESTLLNQAQAEAGRVAEQLGKGESETSIAEELTDGRHPLAALLRLVDSGDTLLHDEWDRARASVAETFGAELAAAAARGKVALKVGFPLERDAAASKEDAGADAKTEELGANEEVQSAVPEAAPASGAGDDSVRFEKDQLPSKKADNPSLPLFAPREQIPAATLIASAGRDESLNELALRALAASGDDRMNLMEVIIWRLMGEGRLALAHGLERACRGEADKSRRMLPGWVLSAAILGKEVRDPAGPIAQRLEMGFLQFGDDCFIAGQDDWNALLRVLMAAGALQPAIMAPATSAPALLHGLRLDECGLRELRMFCEIAASYGDRGQPLEPNCVKDVTAQVNWNDRLDTLKAEADEWRKQAPLYTMIYAPATQVWQRWLEAGGELAELIGPVCNHLPERAEWVRTRCDLWSDPAEVDQAVQRTFRSMKQRKRPIRIEAKALRQMQSRVGEAIRLARKWLGLLETRPDRSQDYVREQALKLRDEVMARYSLLVAEALAWQKESDGSERVAAARCLVSALDELHSLFEPSSKFNPTESDPKYLLSGDLLRVPDLLLDDSWEPGANTESVDALLRGIANPPPDDWQAAFDAKVNSLDLEGSERIIELLLAQGQLEASAASLVARQDRAKREAREALDRDLNATQASVEQAIASGLLREAERLDLSARIEAVRVWMIDGLGFLRARSELQSVRDRLQETSNRELEQTEKRLESLALLDGDPRRVRIGAAIEAHDVWTANEYIDRVEQQIPLPELGKTNRHTLSEFWPDAAVRIAEELEQRQLRGLRHAIGTRSAFGVLRFDSFEPDEQDRARGLVKAWHNVRSSRGKAESDAVRALVQALGFEHPVVDNYHNAKTHSSIQITAQPVSERRLIPVAHFGSQAGGRYRILCVWDSPSDEDLIRRVGDTAHGAPVVVFYFGNVSELKRRGLARLCLEQHRTFIVVDEVLMAFLSAERGARLPVLFACALPFTWLEPFATTAGLVPPEMFYGRRDEREQIQNREGSCFIFGGRQLGKTALLRDVERDFHRPSAGRVAKYLDLKREGIGYDRPESDLWVVMARELKRMEVIPTSIRDQAKSDRIQEGVLAWMNSDPNRRILLLLDEADAFLEGDGKNEWRCSTQLKGLMDDTERRFKVVFAGLHNVQRSVRSANHPLAHYGTPICVGPLIERGQWADARDLIQVPLEVMGFEFESQELVTRILSQANYFPSLLQLYGQQLLRKVADPRSVAFDDRRSPPSIVSGEAVDDAYRNIREAIRQRLQWTLQLDQRYEVLAYALAMEAMSGSMETHTEARSVSWFRDEAVLWWSAGFAGERGSYDSVRAILDEMIGLGVFRMIEPGRYGFRSPNVVSLLGTQLEVEKELERNREDPIEYAPARFRRPDPRDAARRSPLTVEQEEALRVDKNGVSVVFGWELAGLSDLHDFLLSKFGTEFFDQVGAGANLREFEGHLEALEMRSSEGTQLVFVPDDVPWTREWVRLALARCRKLKFRDKHIRVLFAAGPARAWDLLGTPGEGEIDDEVNLITLHPWSDDSLRQWLEEVGIPIGIEDRKKLQEVSGSWPACLYAMRELLGEQTIEPVNVVREVREKSVALARSTVVIQGLGALGEGAHLLTQMAQWSEPIGADELSALVESGNEKLAARVIRWGEVLGLIGSAPSGAFVLDSVVAAAMMAPAE